MGEREIIIADGDLKLRSRLASHFRNSGYLVATAGGTEQLLARVLEGRSPVVILGAGLSGQLAAADLVHLLKRCSRDLHIIMMSDALTRSQARQLRQEGIFYQALRTGVDRGELVQAVDCAFEQLRTSAPDNAWRAAHRRLACAGLPENRRMGRRSVPGPWMAALIALFLSASYYFLAATPEKVHNGSSLSVWIFLAFCALLVVAQVLPIFRFRPAPGRVERPLTQESTPRGGK
jgi:FixJ family two-component response regulator